MENDKKQKRKLQMQAKNKAGSKFKEKAYEP